MKKLRLLFLLLLLWTCIVPAAAQQTCTLSITACHWQGSVCTGLAGASFRLCRSDGTPLTFSPDDGAWQSSSDGQAVLTTDSSGVLRLAGLGPGTYRLQQADAPQLYRPMRNPLLLELMPNGEIRIDGHTVQRLSILHRSGRQLVSLLLLWFGALTPIAVRTLWLLHHNGLLKNLNLWQMSQSFFRFCRKLMTTKEIHLYRRRTP